MYKLLLVTAGVAALGFAGQANAFTYFSVGANSSTVPGTDPGPASDQTDVVTFDATPATGVVETDVSPVNVQTGSNGIGAAPAGDTTAYETVQPGGSATFNFAGYEATNTVGSLSVYIGSTDSYNHLTFYNATGGVIATVNGDSFLSQSGDQNNAASNRRYYFSFLPSDNFTSVKFTTDQIALEFDDISVGPVTYNNVAPGSVFPLGPPMGQGGGVGGVPEPATWALMLLGFGAVGAIARGRRRGVLAL